MPSVFISRARGLLGAAIAALLVLGLGLNGWAAEDAGAADDTLATEKTAAAEETPAPRPNAAPPLDFNRDPVQLVTRPVEVWALEYSANDEFLAAAGGGGRNTPGAGQVQVWDVGKASAIASYPTPRGNLSVALSPDGRRLAWSSWSGEIWLQEVGGAELLHKTFKWPSRVTFSPDGKLLVAAAEGERLQTWDASTGKPLDGFRGITIPVFWVGFSPDGKYLVAAGGLPAESGDGQIVVWDVATRQQLHKLTDNPRRVLFASISPDSQTLATGDENSIVLWDLATGVRRSQTETSGRPVQRIAFSPDGSLLASAGGDSNDGVVTLWDASTGKVLGTISAHKRDVRGMAFTHDGKTLATGGADRSIRLWNVATRQPISVLEESDGAPDGDGETAAILAVAYSPDGKSVATAGEDGRVSIYGLAPPGTVRSWPAHADAAAALAWSPDGRTLASGGYEKVVKLWNPATGELIRSLGGHKNWVVSLAFSHDGQTLASGGYDRSIRLWNVAEGREQHLLAGHTGAVRALAFSQSDKLLASGSADQTVRLWEVGGTELATLSGHEGAVRGVAFSPDDRLLASGGEEGAIKIWDVDARKLYGTLSGHTDRVSAVAFAQETLVSASWDRTIRTWDADSLTRCGSLSTGSSPIVALAVAPDGRRLLTANGERSLDLWKSTGAVARPTLSLNPSRTFPWSAAFSPDGTSLAVAAGGITEETDLYLYDLASGGEKYCVGFPGSVRSIDFAPQGDLLALGFRNRKLLLVDAATGHEVASLEKTLAPADAPLSDDLRSADVAFSADGKWLAAATHYRTLQIYDVEQRRLAKTLVGHHDAVLSVAFSPDGRWLVSGSKDKTAVVWDLARGERRSALPLQPGTIDSVAWSPDGKMLATGCGSGVCSLWNAETGAPLRTIAAHPGPVNAVRFSPDGRLLATGGADRLVKLWDTASGERLQSYACQSGTLYCLRFSPDGKSFATTERGGVKIWPVVPPKPK